LIVYFSYSSVTSSRSSSSCGALCDGAPPHRRQISQNPKSVTNQPALETTRRVRVLRVLRQVRKMQRRHTSASAAGVLFSSSCVALCAASPRTAVSESSAAAAACERDAPLLCEILPRFRVYSQTCITTLTAPLTSLNPKSPVGETVSGKTSPPPCGTPAA
jgi:hypothetical protein